jgi:hypothetical protein
MFMLWSGKRCFVGRIVAAIFIVLSTSVVSAAATSFTTSNISVGIRPFQLATADLNGDGIPDLIVSNGGSNSISVLMGNGDGTFQNRVDFAVGTSPIGSILEILMGMA